MEKPSTWVKQMVCKDTTLRYFDANKPIVIQVDASQKGLGAALLQDGCPVAFASKALTPAEQCYADIERKMLACVFGAEHFHTCLQQIIHYRVWPQAIGTDQSEKPCWRTRKTTENVAMFAELWCKDHLQTWTRDVGSWHLVTVCPSDCSGSSTRPGNPPCPYHTREEESFPTVHPRRSTTSLPGRDHHHWVAWRRHRPAKCTQTLSHPPRCSDCRRSTHPTGRSTHHSTTRGGKSTCIDPWRTHGNLQVLVPSQTVCLLAWYQCRHQKGDWSLCNMPMTSPTGASPATPAHTSTWETLAAPRSWLHDIRR